MTGEARMRALLDSLPGVAVLALDVRGFVLEHNSAADKLFGRVGEGLQGQHFSIVYPATSAGAEQARSALLEAAGSGCHEQVLRLRRGTDAHFVGEVTITSLNVPMGPSQGSLT
jgi:PAS domain S-box-containing protein